MSLKYRSLLTDFANEIGLQPVDDFLKSEEVVIDDTTISLYFEGDEDLGDVVFFTLLGLPDQERSAAVTRVLLEANYLWVGTGGATLGMNPADGQVMLGGRLPLDTLSAEALASVLDSFADTASFWRRYIHNELAKDEALPEGLHTMDRV